jgi:hypothetical protein
MKKILILIMFCSSCGGKLSEDQRKRLHEGMATQDIKRITDAELQESALSYGKSVIRGIEIVDISLKKKSKIDSLAQLYHVRIYSLVPSDQMLLEIEKQLVDAYVAGGGSGRVDDNLQKIGTDSLLYTRPIFSENPDGTLVFSHAIGVMMSKKVVVLSMPQP